MNRNFRFDALKLLIFTVFTVVITVWLASIIGNFQLFASPYTVRAQFSDVTGLLVGDVVKASGVTVGRVEGIEIRNGVAIVSMEIKEDTQIPSDVEAEIRFRNLVGQRMVSIVQPEGSTGAELLNDGDLIALEDTSPAFDLSDLFNGLRPLIRSTRPQDINLVATTLTQALKGRTGELEGLLTNVSEISEVVASKDQELSSLLEGLNVVTADLAGRDAQLDRTLDHINLFFKKVFKNRRALASALVSLEDMAVRLDELVTTNESNIKSELKNLAAILEVVNNRRADLQSLVRTLPEMLVAIERVTGYGEWTNIHVIDICKDDFGSCGTRGTP